VRVLDNHKTGRSTDSTDPPSFWLRYSWTVWTGLFLILTASPVLWAQSSPIFSDSNQTEAAKAYRLGMSLVKAGRADDAITAFKNGIETDPQSAALLNVIGATFTLKGDFGQAENYLLKCLQIDPEFAAARIVTS